MCSNKPSSYFSIFTIIVFLMIRFFFFNVTIGIFIALVQMNDVDPKRHDGPGLMNNIPK